MNSWPPPPKPVEPAGSTVQAGALADAGAFCESLVRLRAAADPALAGLVFEEFVAQLGVDAAIFTHVLRLEGHSVAYRSLLACDAALAGQRASAGWFANDPWLQYASRHSEPVCASALASGPGGEHPWVQTAARHGFASALIVPAPSSDGPARIGALYLGSATPGHFEAGGQGLLQVLAWPLALQLQAWWHQYLRRELQEHARLTPHELDLLRWEAAGHGSKQIAALLHTLPQTIDCRFQRLCTKLEAPNRRVAVHIAQLHGLV